MEEVADPRRDRHREQKDNRDILVEEVDLVKGVVEDVVMDLAAAANIIALREHHIFEVGLR